MKEKIEITKEQLHEVVNNWAMTSVPLSEIMQKLQPTYEDALQFIIDNEDKDAKFYVYYESFDYWTYIDDCDTLTPFVKYMPEEKCKEFIEKFKNVKPC